MIILIAALVGIASPVPWSEDLLWDQELWRLEMNGPVVTFTERGLRVEIGQGKDWAIVAISHVDLADRFSHMHCKIGDMSEGAGWVIKLSKKDGDRFQDWLPFGVHCKDLKASAELNPWFTMDLSLPLDMIQVGLEGGPGDYVLFEKIWFTSVGDPPKAHGQRKENDGQIDIPCVEMMPKLPRPYVMKDWHEAALTYDNFVFDFKAEGELLPLIWLDDSRVNMDRQGFGLPSYVGASQEGSDHEGITTMGAVLGATLCGVDKRKGEHDYVLMCEAYFNRANGEDLVMNRVKQKTGHTFWYEIWPNMVFDMLVSCYPEIDSMGRIMERSAQRWAEACPHLKDASGRPDFDHTSFDFGTMKPVDNGRWREPDGAAGIAWIEYMAWVKFGDERFLKAAEWALQFLEEREDNPYYEVLMPYGAYIAARMNEELGRDYDVDKFIRWSFGLSQCRPGWGVVLGKWNGYDCHGLAGSATDYCGGYAFAMNGFAQAAALVPLARYDPRYARAIGKWMLNLANASRLFYPDELPEDLQSCAWWQGDPNGVIAYEGLRKAWEGKSPYAMGDPTIMNWGPKTNLGLYGSGYVGMLGGIVKTTNVEGILQLDCLKTDFFHKSADPTYLYYNPHATEKEVEIDVGPGLYLLMDAVAEKVLAREVSGKTRFAVDPDDAVLLVISQVPTMKPVKLP